MKKQNNLLLGLYTLGLSVMLILRDLAGVSISKYIIIAYTLVFMAMASYDVLVYMLCFTFPLACGLPGTYIMLGALVLLIIKRKTINFWQLGMLLFVAVAEVVASFWYPSQDWVNVVGYISFAGVMMLLIHDNKEVDAEHCIRLYLYGVILLCGVIMIATLEDAPSDWLTRFARGAFRFGEKHSVDMEGMMLSLNANSLAYYSITGIACGIFCAERSKGLQRLLYIAMGVFSAVVGFLTVSRSWVLVAVICLLLYILSKLRSPKQFLTLAMVLGVLVAVGYAFLTKNPELMNGFVVRFEDDTVESGGGRTKMFLLYMNAFLDNPRAVLMGAGVTQYKTQFDVVGSVHNGTQQILVCYGIPGFIIMMVGLVRPIFAALGAGKGKRTVINWLPILGVVLFVQTIQFLNPLMLMLPYVIGIYALRAGGKSNENLSDNRGHGGGQSLGLGAR